MAHPTHRSPALDALESTRQEVLAPVVPNIEVRTASMAADCHLDFNGVVLALPEAKLH